MKKYIYAFALLLVVGTTKAQKVDFTVGADIVSSYIWRGSYQTSTAVQPAMGINVGGFSLSAWGSVPFEGIAKEVDFTASYETAGLSLAVTDYWWAGEGAQKYFMYESKKTAHLFEGIVGYTLPCEKFPLSLSWNTLFAGADYLADGDRAHSTYISAAYPFSIQGIGLSASLGFTPWKGIYADDFSIVNIGLKSSKEIKITGSFSLPVFGEVITNPRSEEIFFVLGISL